MKLLSARVPGRGRQVELDFVRGIAIIAVMGYHFHAVNTRNWLIAAIEYPLKNFGREGVNLFFTLSGFLVGGLLMREYAETGGVDARRFIVRRIFKIWPAYYMLILFHVVVGRHPSSTFLLQNLTHMQNYFGTSIAQTWSLAVEEHFYLFLPALMMLFAYLRLRVHAMLCVLGALCVLVLVARSVAVWHGQIDAAFFYTQYRIDSLLFGVMLAAVYWMKPATYRYIAERRALLVVLVAALVAWLVLFRTRVFIDESIGYTLQAVGYAAFIVLVLEHTPQLRQTRAFRVVAWIGVYSYGIYLWHSIALAPGDLLIRKAVGAGLPPSVVWLLAIAAQFAIAIIAGYVTTRAVEFPFLRIRDALVPRQRRRTGAHDLPNEGAAS